MGRRYHAVMMKVAFLCVLILLARCASGVRLKTADDVMKKTMIEADPFNNTTQIIGPEISTGNLSSNLTRLLVYSKTGFSSSYELYVHYFGQDWFFFDRAYDTHGRRLIFKRIDEDADLRGNYESFSVKLSRGQLDEASKLGLSIKAGGDFSSTMVNMPAFYVQGFLEKVDIWESSMRK